MTTLTRQQVRELDRRAIEEFGVPGIVLMENAGRGAAEVLMRLNPERRPVVINCGKGNNGGDGFVIARHLDIHGVPVVVAVFEDPTTLTGDAALNYRIAAASRIKIIPAFPRPAGIELTDVWAYMKVVKTDADALRDMKPAWAVDALFGTGLNGPIGQPLGSFIGALNAGKRSEELRILAVDIPSGLDCDTGKPLGPCVRADHTVTFVAPKAGFANPEASEWLGEVHVVDIGAPRVLLEQYGINR